MPSNRVMDALPEPPPSCEEGFTQKLVACGLSAHGLYVSYDDDLQSYEIVVGPSANTTPEMFACIREAAAGEIVTFDDPALNSAYHAFVAEAFRPQMLASAEAELSKRGLLNGFPRRADFSSDALFAEALAFQPPPEALRDFTTAMDRYGCLLSAIQLATARGEGKFGFVGNEYMASPD